MEKNAPEFSTGVEKCVENDTQGQGSVPGGNRFQVKITSPDESGDAEFSFLRNLTFRRDASEKNQIHEKISGSERCDQMYMGLSSVYALEFLSGHVNG